MEWSKGVAQAISKSKVRHTPLLVLVEPPSAIVFNIDDSAESAKDLYSRVATNSLHDRLFENDAVQKLVRESAMLCVRLSEEPGDKDFFAFSSFFKLDPPPPNLFLISPATGGVLYQAKGYVSPVTFARELARVMKLVSNRTMTIPESLRPRRKSGVNPFDQVDFSSSSSSKKNESDVHQVTPKTTVNNSNETKSMKIPGHTRLRARLPNGQQVERRFEQRSTFKSVRAWLSNETGKAESGLQISLQFPRQVFTVVDDVKRLDELSLIPSASLIVVFSSGALGDGSSSRMESIENESANGSTTGRSGWRALNAASSAFGVVSSFVRSFVNPEPSGMMTGEGQTNGGNSLGGSGLGNVAGTARPRLNRIEPRSGRQQQHQQQPTTFSMTRDEDGNRRQGGDGNDDDDDDRQWLSNGNSTQFGWNPSDVEDERNE